MQQFEILARKERVGVARLGSDDQPRSSYHSSNTNKIEDIVRDLKKYSSKQIIKAIQENNAESRKEWMLNIFSFTGSQNNNKKTYQFWKQDYHPIELDTAQKLTERLDYLHDNPVRSGLFWETWHYKYSSAIDYYTNEKGLIKLYICQFKSGANRQN